MANIKTKSFPMLPVNHWWALREQFKHSIPGVITVTYLGSVLNVQPDSARANILPYLKEFGLIDDEGKPEELATRWRDDEHYPEVCNTILHKVYPDELIAAVSDGGKGRETIMRWFANSTGKGKTAVERMTAIYVVLSEADISKKPGKKGGKESKKTKEKALNKADGSLSTSNTKPKTDDHPRERYTPTAPEAPGIHINLEIHISSDASPDQIDKIFESMAKHIYKK